MKSAFTTLFLDVGGVLLTNGWDHQSREDASEKFQLDFDEMNKRHALTFDTYEIGKITLDVYLDRVVFYVPRNFSREEFKQFMFAQSHPHEKMIQMIRDLKLRYSLRTVAVSNEGRELMNHRIDRFCMNEFFDFFVCSGYVGLRKPDEAIFKMALEIAHVDPCEVIYIDDRLMLTQVASSLGMQSIEHKNFHETQNILNSYLTGN